jgi:hypothetical protein
MEGTKMELQLSLKEFNIKGIWKFFKVRGLD